VWACAGLGPGATGVQQAQEGAGAQGVPAVQTDRRKGAAGRPPACQTHIVSTCCVFLRARGLLQRCMGPSRIPCGAWDGRRSSTSPSRLHVRQAAAPTRGAPKTKEQQGHDKALHPPAAPRECTHLQRLQALNMHPHLQQQQQPLNMHPTAGAAAPKHAPTRSSSSPYSCIKRQAQAAQQPLQTPPKTHPQLLQQGMQQLPQLPELSHSQWKGTMEAGVPCPPAAVNNSVHTQVVNRECSHSTICIILGN
jgi:hypothetical protein